MQLQLPAHGQLPDGRQEFGGLDHDLLVGEWRVAGYTASVLWKSLRNFDVLWVCLKPLVLVVEFGPLYAVWNGIIETAAECWIEP